eukprot:639647-Amphidinium_carterae.1
MAEETRGKQKKTGQGDVVNNFLDYNVKINHYNAASTCTASVTMTPRSKDSGRLYNYAGDTKGATKDDNTLINDKY